MIDLVRIQVVNDAREDEDALISRVPCVGECIQYPSGRRTRRVRVLSVCHVEGGVVAARVSAEDVVPEPKKKGERQ